MKSIEIADMLENAQMLVSSGRPRVGAAFAELAEVTKSFGSRTIAQAFGKLPRREGKGPDTEVGHALGVLMTLLTSAGAKKAANDVELILEVMAAAPATSFREIVAYQPKRNSARTGGKSQSPRPRKSPETKSSFDVSNVVQAYRSAVDGAAPRDALQHIDTLNKLKVAELKLLLQALEVDFPKSARSKKDLLDRLRTPYNAAIVRIDKERAIRAPGTL